MLENILNKTKLVWNVVCYKNLRKIGTINRYLSSNIRK